MSVVHNETILKVLATARLTADLRLAGGRMLGQAKPLKGVKAVGTKLVADDLTFYALPARVAALCIKANGLDLMETTDIADDSRAPVGGDLLLPLSGGFLGE